MSWMIGVDVGGTFTDLYAYDAESGGTAVHKTPSTPDDPARAILDGLAALCRAAGIAPDAIDRFAHGTTVATNALIQRKGGRIAVVTTKGFRDLLEIGRQVRPKIYDLKADAPPPLAPRQLRFEVAERVGPEGQVIRPLDRRSVEETVARIAASEVDGVAVCLLFSFLAPEHEQRVRAAIHAQLPQMPVSLSSEVQPEFREYERLSTTALNAYLQPVVSRYLANLAGRIAGSAPKASVGINQSSGGLMSVSRAVAFPVRTALSGPAAGVVGAVHCARLSERANVVTLDMGGTSTDVCLIKDGAAEMTFNRDVAGLPVRLPSIDIHTIGAGGGSIAAFGPDGLLKVGPESAGAVPGPACYGRGGALPTVSDANLVLDRLSTRLVGGGMSLDRAKAEAAIRPIAERLGTSIEVAALGIVRVVNSNMVRALRAVSVERGHDPRAFTLMPFGGAGPLHAVDLARDIGIREVLVPYAPGILCAQGLVVADLRESLVATCRQRLDADLAPIEAALARLMQVAETWFAAERVSKDRRQVTVDLDMRYVGQNYELQIAVPLSAGVRMPQRAEMARLFFAEHRRRYGHHDPAAPIEVVNVRLTAVGKLPDPGVPRFTASAGREAAGTRPVWFDGNGAVTTRVVDRATLAPGSEISGPAIVDQLDATTVLPPGTRARVDQALNLIVEVTP